MPKLPKEHNRRIQISTEKFELTKGLNETIVKLAQDISKIYIPLIKFEAPKIPPAFFSDQIELAKSMAKLARTSYIEDLGKLAETAKRFSDRVDAHFPDNWPKDKTTEAADLCISGVPIIFVPRPSVIAKIVNAKDMKGIKQVLNRNSEEIIEDCENVFRDAKWLSKDMREHIAESIDSYQAGHYRAAQSTAVVAFDTILNDIVDIKAWRKQKKSTTVLSANVVKKYTDASAVDLMNLPLMQVPFYTILMLPIIGQMLANFALGDKTTYVNDANRHMSTHTVSAKQYKKSNALLTIMTIASICKVTQLQGKNWVQTSTQQYGFTL